MQNTFFFHIFINILKISKKIFIFFFIFLTILYTPIAAQSPKKLFILSIDAQDKGDFIKAEKYLITIVKQKENIKEENLVAVYNHLGIINKSLGKYNKAIAYYLKGENIALNNRKNIRYRLPSIYINLANTFKYKGDYTKALDYFWEAINNLNVEGLSENQKKVALAHAYNNMSLVYMNQKKYDTAKSYFEKSISIKKKNNHNDIYNTYINYANCLRETKDYLKADKYYQICTRQLIKEYGKDYYKLAYLYKSYGKLKVKMGDYDEGLDLYNKALKSYIINFGETHPYTAEMYEIFGDYYSEQKNYKKALGYYQKSLIANSKTFNSADIVNNPNTDAMLSEIQLLRSLKKKSSALLAASNENRKKSEPQLKLSLNSLELALKVIRSMRNSFVSTESKLYITENEKEFYILAIESALRLHELNGQNKYIEKAYEFSQKSKAAVLINEINLNEAFLQIIPKHLKEKKSELQQNIQSYKKLIFDENEKREPSESKITLWQSELFKINKDYEDFLKQVKMDYPDYSKLMSKTEIYDLSKLQKELNSYEILVEYSYSLKENNDQLYTFVISHKGLNYYRTQIDEEFKQNLHYFKQTVSNTRQESMTLDEYNKLNTVSHELYKILLKPLGYDFNTKKIIIVPDEQIAYLSFDALLPSYEPESTINFAGLNYLVYDYQFTYAYSSNLLFNQQEKNKQSSFVYAFAPSYHKISTNQSRQSLGELKSSKKEINSVLHFFEGKAFIGDSAIKDNFKSLMHKSGIFHFALHAKSEQNDSKYSFLAFTSLDSINNNNLMYNYEISSSAMNASMVVLSACNTGDGEIYSGEGVMSLSRGFILAGVSSVVQTLWEVRDETSFLIMESFYKNLSEGTSKREALQLAKINYIKNASPQLVNPSYWSAYVIMGNYSPIAKSYWLIITLFILFLIFGAGITIVILKRKK